MTAQKNSLMLKIKFALIFFLVAGLAQNANGQGCSDAGFCTINNFKPGGSDSTLNLKNQFKLGLTYGSADNSISVAGNYLEYNRQMGAKWGIDFKLASLSQSGNDISVLGLSDIYLNAGYKAGKKIKLTAGVKIPLNDGNKMKDNLALPMDYQSSLGTFDLIAGISFEENNFQVIAASQLPLTQNENTFIAENYPVNSEIRTFQTTYLFKRSGDVLLRFSYSIKLGEKFKITPSVLPIYHLANDKFTDVSGVEREIDGSQGLTLNGNLYFDYDIKGRSAFQLNAGAPFVVRDARPDGLTRHFVANLEYRITF